MKQNNDGCMRCDEPGWQEIARPDGRRGLWMKQTEGQLELCAGRDGDDAHVLLVIGDEFDEPAMRALVDVVEYTAYAFEMAEMGRDAIEDIILEVIGAAASDLRPSQLRELLIAKGLEPDETRPVVQAMVDAGKLKVGSDLKIQVGCAATRG